MAKPLLRINKESIQKLEDKFDKILSNLVAECENMLETHAGEVMIQSNDEIPKDTLSALDSEFIDDVKTRDHQISIRYGYSSPESTKINPVTGKPTSEYVWELHEIFTYHVHGKPKYLEDPTTQSVDRFKTKVEEAMNNALKSGR